MKNNQNIKDIEDKTFEAIKKETQNTPQEIEILADTSVLKELYETAQRKGNYVILHIKAKKLSGHNVYGIYKRDLKITQKEVRK
jgi:hypothetical protein